MTKFEKGCQLGSLTPLYLVSSCRLLPMRFLGLKPCLRIFYQLKAKAAAKAELKAKCELAYKENVSSKGWKGKAHKKDRIEII